MSEVTIKVSKEAIGDFFLYLDGIYGSLGPADDDIIEMCGEGLENLDEFFDALRKAS